MPTLAQIYEQHAEECIRTAAKMDDPKRRDLLLKLASQWREDAQVLRRGALSAPSGHLPRCGVTSVEWGQSGVRRIVRAAGDAKDHERVDFTFVRTHQDGTAISAFTFDSRIRRFQHWRCLGQSLNDKRHRNDLERLLWKCGHCCNQFQSLKLVYAVVYRERRRRVANARRLRLHAHQGLFLQLRRRSLIRHRNRDIFWTSLLVPRGLFGIAVS